MLFPIPWRQTYWRKKNDCKLLPQTRNFIINFRKYLPNGCNVSSIILRNAVSWRDIMFFSSSHICDVHYAYVTRCCYTWLYFCRLVLELSADVTPTEDFLTGGGGGCMSVWTYRHTEHTYKITHLKWAITYKYYYVPHWPAVSVYNINPMEQSKLLNFSATFLVSSSHLQGHFKVWIHCSKAHWQAGWLLHYFILLNNKVGIRLCGPWNMEVTDSRPLGTGSVQLCCRACSHRDLDFAWPINPLPRRCL